MAREPVPVTEKFGYSYPLKGRSDAFLLLGRHGEFMKPHTQEYLGLTVYDSESQVPELPARVVNNKQYNIRLLGVPSHVYPSSAAIPLCIASQSALSASLFLLSFASNSGKMQ